MEKLCLTAAPWQKALWLIGQVGTAYDREKIGEVDWYRWGVDLLLPAQMKDGGWSSRVIINGKKKFQWFELDRGLSVHTAYAILFLTHTDPAPDATRMVRENRPRSPHPTQSIGDRESEALGKLGQAQEMAKNDPDKAAPLLEKLIADFPGTSSAVDAKRLLERLPMEKLAAAKLKLVEHYYPNDQEKLKQVAKQFPGTAAAARAQKLLKALDK